MDLPQHLAAADETRKKSRAKERIFSFRNAEHAWDPKISDRRCGNCIIRKSTKGESIRVFPISNWTETDIWQYIKREKYRYCPAVFCKESGRWLNVMVI